MTITIHPGDPRDPQATALLQASHALMTKLFAPGDNHFLEIEGLCTPEIRFFLACEGNATLGCAALANKGSYGEIKSMFVTPAARGKGVGEQLMRKLDQEAREQGLTDIKLETGDALEAAIRLYQRHGFAICGPFGHYEPSDASVFMEKSLT
jgi:putative acetyltransferase